MVADMRPVIISLQQVINIIIYRICNPTILVVRLRYGMLHKLIVISDCFFCSKQETLWVSIDLVDRTLGTTSRSVTKLFSMLSAQNILCSSRYRISIVNSVVYRILLCLSISGQRSSFRSTNRIESVSNDVFCSCSFWYFKIYHATYVTRLYCILRKP